MYVKEIFPVVTVDFDGIRAYIEIDHDGRVSLEERLMSVMYVPDKDGNTLTTGCVVGHDICKYPSQPTDLWAH